MRSVGYFKIVINIFYFYNEAAYNCKQNKETAPLNAINKMSGIDMPTYTGSREDEKWMSLALKSARAAAENDEVPVGAVVVVDDTLVSAAGNQPIGLKDPTAHAEIRALRAASLYFNNYRLPGTTLYVTLEPCIMCMGAIIHARVDRLVYGAADPKTGAAHSIYQVGTDGLLNHYIETTSGVLETECSELLRDFFRARRAKS